MTDSGEVELIGRILAQTEGTRPVLGDTSELEVEHYVSPEHHDAELAALFTSHPVIVCHTSEVSEANTFVPNRLGNREVLVTRCPTLRRGRSNRPAVVVGRAPVRTPRRC